MFLFCFIENSFPTYAIVWKSTYKVRWIFNVYVYVILFHSFLGLTVAYKFIYIYFIITQAFLQLS